MAGRNTLLDRIAGRRILIVGDLMLDHFVVGRVDRISPEAPVPVVRFERQEYRVGGAANVAANVTALGGQAEVVGLIGDDAGGRELLGRLSDLPAGTSGVVVDATRCTTRKLRVVTTRNQQVARVDYESDREVEGEAAGRIVEAIHRGAGGSDAILVSDYLKGVVSREVAEACAEVARAQRVPLLVDPKVPHIDYYRDAAIITPNHHEAEAVTHMRIRSDEEARTAARRFRDRTGCEAVLITRGEDGMWLLAPDGEVALHAEAREVADVTGAGDTVIAALALGLAAGGPLVDAARLANRAAGVVVARFGPATVSLEELRSDLPAEAAGSSG